MSKPWKVTKMNSRQRRRDKRFRRNVVSVIARGDYIPDLTDLRAAGGLTAGQAARYAKSVAQRNVDFLASSTFFQRLRFSMRVLFAKRPMLIERIPDPFSEPAQSQRGG